MRRVTKSRHRCRLCSPVTGGAGSFVRKVHQRTGTAEGFTLMEMLLVVMIIGILAAMIVPRLIPQTEQARIKIAQAEVDANLPAALDLFLLNVGRYPTSEEGLDALWSRPASVPDDQWKGPYVKRKEIADPWGRRFIYYCPPRQGGLDFDLISGGPDGVENTEDDIANWDKSGGN